MPIIKAWESQQQRKENGFHDIASFMKKKRNRPPTHISPANQTEPPTKKQKIATQQSQARADSSAKKSRTNWSKGENAVRLSKAVRDWFDKTGLAINCNGEEVTLKKFSALVNIPYKTLVSYTKVDPTKRRALGSSHGREPILKPDEKSFFIDVLRRADRGNERIDRREAIDMLQDLLVDRGPPSRKTCSRILTRHILNHPDCKGLLKPSTASTKVDATEERAKDITHGLHTFMLKPEELKGEALFDHMVLYRKRNIDERQSMPSGYLAIDVDNTQASILKPSAKELTQRSIIEGIGGERALLQLAERTLEIVRKINSNVQNSDERLRRLKLEIQLTESIAKVRRIIPDKNDENDIAKIKNEWKSMAPAAAEKYMRSGKVSREEICVLLFAAFGEFKKESSCNKAKLEDLLAAYVAKESKDPIRKLFNSNETMRVDSPHAQSRTENV